MTAAIACLAMIGLPAVSAAVCVHDSPAAGVAVNAAGAAAAAAHCESPAAPAGQAESCPHCAVGCAGSSPFAIARAASDFAGAAGAWQPSTTREPTPAAASPLLRPPRGA